MISIPIHLGKLGKSRTPLSISMAQLNFLDLKAQLLEHLEAVEAMNFGKPAVAGRFLEWTPQDWMALIWMMRHTRHLPVCSPKLGMIQGTLECLGWFRVTTTMLRFWWTDVLNCLMHMALLLQSPASAIENLGPPSQCGCERPVYS